MNKINEKNYAGYGPFRLWTIENFPFIEQDFDAITNYQLWCRIVDNMNKIIANQNKLQDSQKELVQAFNDLVDYVNNYFENLDVQDEINNKLDEMAESGELAEIVTAYLQVNGVLAFNSISDLESATNIIEGSSCYILGENNYNDGKGAYYKIRLKTSGDVIDHYNIVETTDVSLVGERLPNYYINEIVEDVASNTSNIESLNTEVNTIKNEMGTDYEHGNKNFAHRGLCSEAPENTVASVYKAGYHGCYGVEIDVQVSSDNVIYLMHDSTIDRMTNGSGKINELTSTYLDTLEIDAGNNVSSYPTLRIPKLSEILNICNNFNIVPMIELKENWVLSTLNLLVDELKNYNFINRAIILSGNYNLLVALRNINSKLQLCYLTGETVTQNIVENVNNIGNCGLSMPYTNNADIDESIRLYMIEHKIPFGFWTLNTYASVHPLLTNNPGTSFIVSDYGWGGQIKNYNKQMVGYLTNNGTIVTWGNLTHANISFMYDEFTVTLDNPTTKEYQLTYTTPLDNITDYNGIINFIIQNNKMANYYVSYRTQNNNGFKFTICDSTGTAMTLSELYTAIGNAYISINVTCYNG